MAAVEVMINTPYISELIQKQKLSEMRDIMAYSRNDLSLKMRFAAEGQAGFGN